MPGTNPNEAMLIDSTAAECWKQMCNMFEKNDKPWQQAFDKQREADRSVLRMPRAVPGRRMRTQTPTYKRAFQDLSPFIKDQFQHKKDVHHLEGEFRNSEKKATEHRNNYMDKMYLENGRRKLRNERNLFDYLGQRMEENKTWNNNVADALRGYPKHPARDESPEVKKFMLDQIEMKKNMWKRFDEEREQCFFDGVCKKNHNFASAGKSILETGRLPPARRPSFSSSVEQHKSMASVLGRSKRDDPDTPFQMPAINETSPANNGYPSKTQQELRDAGLLQSRSGVTKTAQSGLKAPSGLSKSALPPTVPKRRNSDASRISRLSQFSSVSLQKEIQKAVQRQLAEYGLTPAMLKESGMDWQKTMPLDRSTLKRLPLTK